MTPIRKLRNIRIREVSLVDRAANPGAQVMLAKRDTTEDIMPMPNAGSFDQLCTAISKRDNVTKSCAIDKALKTEVGQALFQIAMLHDIAKAKAKEPDADDVLPSAFEVAVKQVQQRNPTWTKSQCQDDVMRTRPDLWAAAKRARMPLADDGNVLRQRGPYQ